MNTGDIFSLVNDTYYTLGPKTFWYLFSKNSLFGFVFLVIALIISIIRSYSTGDPGIAGFLRIASWFSFILAVVGFVIAFVSGKIVHKNTGFMLGEDALLLRHGVFTKEEFAIPYRQIQNIEIERTFGDQMMGISKLIILTAGHEGDEEEKKDDPEGIIPSIDLNIAVSLEGELLKRANIQRVIQVK
ncbi:MAG TPA: PH domain-containing protein [Candidatus Paceibacterota bacterium]